MTTATDDPVGTTGVDTADEAGSAPGDRRFRPDVEGLRAVAVLLVVLYHANLPGLHGGYVGVDVFFVISGFVITGLLLRERSTTNHNSLVSFYGRRARRILPAATLTIVITVIATYVVLGAVYGNPTAVAAKWTAVFLANFHIAAIGTNYLTTRLPPSPLQNFWSLAVEEQFYLVYPAVFLLAASLRSTVTLRARLVFILVPTIMLSFLYSVTLTQTSPGVAFFSPLTRAWELGLGALVAVGTPYFLRMSRFVGGAISWVGIGAIGIAAVAYSTTTSYPGSAAALPVVGTAFVIAGGTPVSGWGAESVLRLAPFQWFGRLSYSLYLWHWPILVIAAESTDQYGTPFHKNIVWLALAVLVSYATYRLVENPVRHARALARRRWLPIGLGIVLIATSLVVASVALAAHNAAHNAATGPIVPLSHSELNGLVRLAPFIQTMPPDLTPPLDQVQANWGGPGPPCWAADSQTSIPTCEFGDPNGTKTLAIYGDSHAEMWFKAIDRIALAARWRVIFLGKGSCAAVDLPFRNPAGLGAANGVFQQCDEWHQFALGRMRSMRPDLIVVSQSDSLKPDGSLYSPVRWEAAMISLIRTLPVPPDRVIILGNIPRLVHGGPECLSLNRNSVQKCSSPNAPDVVVHNSAERRAAQKVGARYIDTVPWFCSSICTDVIGHFLPYWNTYHVTADFSIALSGVLADSIDLASYSPIAASSAQPSAGSSLPTKPKG